MGEPLRARSNTSSMEKMILSAMLIYLAPSCLVMNDCPTISWSQQWCLEKLYLWLCKLCWQCLMLGPVCTNGTPERLLCPVTLTVLAVSCIRLDCVCDWVDNLFYCSRHWAECSQEMAGCNVGGMHWGVSIACRTSVWQPNTWQYASSCWQVDFAGCSVGIGNGVLSGLLEDTYYARCPWRDFD